MPSWTEGELNAGLLMDVCASPAPMIGVQQFGLQVGELANCSLVLLATEGRRAPT